MGLSLEGIGVALGSRDGYAVVEKVIPGGATDRAKALLPKDKIIAVAQEQGQFVDVIDMALRDVVRLIRGKRGTKVHLRVLRQDATTSQFTVTIVRDKIDLEESAASLRWETREREGKALKLAVIDLPAFYGDQSRDRHSSSDVRRLLAQAKQEGADGVLIDLSRNGGGLLDSGIEIAGFFLRKGGVVAVKDTYAQTKVLSDPDPALVYSGPLVVLTSRMSASASEIVAGALKDYGRAVVVGDGQTFGKGTVQSVVKLPPGLGALKVTTALFFRPGGASTQLDGVASDVVVPSPFEVTGFSEAESGNALGNETIDAFRSDDANGRDGNGWRAVEPSRLAELARRSAERVKGDAEFAELAKRIEQARAQDGTISVGEILEGRRNGDGSERDPETGELEPPADEEKAAVAPQLREAIEILADHVALSLG
jgi:carboxyl-terminal processing protease